ncbi:MULTISPECIES: ABC-type transport auxiliary lipoprotein family protein [unclassified Brevundimonas]|uniref:ABC-type transport auxiliary lipoprotein family protein n=1 Tax=unclassified Brevundimonas TaxID=2622653 RepID=UPI0025C3B607|nr:MULTISPECIES: ABC-type transport auxiliary lipoprotein family protein [unclassified Brevundimonas]
MIRLSSVAVVAAGLTLSACAVLKTPDPVQTYRFGTTPAFGEGTAQGSVPSCAPTGVNLRRVEFNAAARGDQILTATGNETAYVGGARWVGQASTLFEDALQDGFATGAPCLRVTSGPLTRNAVSLTVDVRRFETVYSTPGAAPEIKIAVSVQLLRRDDRAIIKDARFDVIQNADANRVSSIVAAYNGATAEAVRKIVEWTVQEVATMPPGDDTPGTPANRR